MIYKESQEQIAFIQWARNPLVLKQYPELEMLYCNHNTQRLTMMQAKRWKSLGGRSGIPDLFLAVERHFIKFNGLYIEFKNPDSKPKTIKSKGGLSEAQLEFFPKLREQGYKVIVCYNCKEAIDEVIKYLENKYD